MNRQYGEGISALFPLFVILSFCVTILSGLSGALLPSLDYLPVIGHTSFSISPWMDFFTYPGIQTSIQITLFSGWTAALSSVLLSFLFISFFHGTPIWRIFEKSLAPILSIPHAAFAVGFAFLIAPSGWIMRIISPTLTGFHNPPDLMLLNDPNGICLTISLIIKEFPFLMVVAISALGQMDVEKTLLAGRALGYQKEQVWLKIILPRLYTHIRLPVFAVIAYSLSVVDMAILLGPNAPPPLSVLILNWFNDPDVTHKLLAAAGSLSLFMMVGASIMMAFLGEIVVQRLMTPLILNGNRTTHMVRWKGFILMSGAGIIAVTLLASVMLLIWSVTLRWQFPDILPEAFATRHWIKSLDASIHPLRTTITIGFWSAFSGIILTIGCLEHEVISKKGNRFNYNRYIHWFLYLPLMIPQITFMAGIQLLLVVINADGMRITLIWSHLLFVLPYLFIALRGSYLAFDSRYTDQAVLLKRSYFKALFCVKLPMLLRPLLFAFAIGFSVSVAQYIPTILVGAGRFTTITTEVVSIASGSDRRILASYALIQQLIPMLVYLLAIIAPPLYFRFKKGV